MTDWSTGSTRHKEYSLIVAVGMAAILLMFGTVQHLAVLAVLNAGAIATILYSAFSVVRHADVLAHRFGEPYGSLILSLSIVTLEAGLISILMLTGAAGEELLRDTIYSVIIIVMSGFVGFALLLGGRKYGSQFFNFSGIKHYLISIIPLSLVVLVLPATLGEFSTGQMFVVSGCCLLVYSVFLRIQTVTHRSFFVYEEEDDDGHHGKPSAHGNAWHFALLGVHLVAVIGVAKLGSEPLQSMLETLGAPAATSGFLIALLILSPEGTGAFRAILNNQVQRAMNLLLGSVLATISLTVPLVTVIAFLLGEGLTLALPLPDIILLVATLMVSQTALTSGSTNAHSGAVLATLMLVYMMLLFA